MGTPGSTGAAGAVRLASLHRDLAWSLATMQVDMNLIFESGAQKDRVAKTQVEPEGETQ